MKITEIKVKDIRLIGEDDYSVRVEVSANPIKTSRTLEDLGEWEHEVSGDHVHFALTIRGSGKTDINELKDLALVKARDLASAISEELTQS